MKRAARPNREYFGRPRSGGPAPPPPRGRGGRPEDRGGRGGGDRGRGGGGRGMRRRPRLSKEQPMK
eukprot:8570318-Pyramimonas_sp.AAC.1